MEFVYKGKPSSESEIVNEIAIDKDVEVTRINYPIAVSRSGKAQAFRESNLFYYSVAASFAYSQRIRYVLAGQIFDDWKDSGTHEASPEFYETMNRLLSLEY